MDENFQNQLVGKFQSGQALYQILEDNCPADTEVLICPAHIGDTLWIACFADAYKAQHGCDRLLFVTPQAQAELPTLFPAVDEVLPLPSDQLGDLCFYIGSREYWYHSRIRYAHFRFQIISDQKSVRFRDQLPEGFALHEFMNSSRCLMLDLPYDSAKSVPIPPSCTPELREQYRHSVLLMPAALTQPGGLLSASFWEHLAAALTERNYHIYCNYNGLPTEVLIDGTIPLASSLTQMYHLAGAFDRFIGLRSGICDLLALAHAPLSVIHPRYDSIPSLVIPPDAPIRDHLCQLDPLAPVQTLQYRAEWEDDLIAEILAVLPPV